MPSHTIAERLKNTARGLRRNIPAQGTTGNENVLTRIGQVQDQTRQVTPKALEQPLVRVGSPIGRGMSIAAGGIKRSLKTIGKVGLGLLSAGTPVGAALNIKRAFLGTTRAGGIKPVVAGGVKRTTKAGGAIDPGTGTLTVTLPSGTRRVVSLTEDEKKAVMALQPGQGIGNFSIGRTTAAQENLKLLASRRRKPKILTAEEIEASERRDTKLQTVRKSRRADIKSVNESINVLVKQLGTIPDFEDNDSSRLRITDQIDALSAIRRDLLSGGGEGRSGGGSRGGGANFDTPEGFAAFLASKNIPPEERLSLTRRLFANGP